MTSLSDIFGDNQLQVPAESPPKDTYGDRRTPTARPNPTLSRGLSDHIRSAATAAASAVDAELSAKAARDVMRRTLQAKMDEELLELEAAYQGAKTVRQEAERLLKSVMETDKITRIPMDDRPDIVVKSIPGSRRDITKTWLADPNGVVVKTFGVDAPEIIWNAVPRSQARTELVIPPKYEDEPLT